MCVCMSFSQTVLQCAQSCQITITIQNVNKPHDCHVSITFVRILNKKSEMSFYDKTYFMKI